MDRGTEQEVAAARAFGIGGVEGVKALSSGLMHRTYKIEGEGGSYVLQRMHPLLASDAAVRDFMHVTEHLNARGFSAPKCLRTPEGAVAYHDGRNVYRMYTFVPGTTVAVIGDARRAAEAGAITARFHEAMKDFSQAFESPLVLHDTPAIHAAFEQTFRERAGDPLMTAEAKEMGEFLLAELPRLYLPEGLPKRTAHGDLKVTNIIFDEEGNAVSIIDFDTCNRMTLPIEMGDAFRSWCGREEDRADNEFSLEWFKAGWEGYFGVAQRFLEPQEREHIVQGVLLITLELATRFLKDYFDDSYFGWDDARYPTRREHNFARAKGQIALYRDLLRKREEAEGIVRA